MEPKAQESFGLTEAVGKLARPDVGFVISRGAGAAWRSDDDSGFSYQPLFEESETGHRTMIMKVDAGVETTPHAHEDLEQVYVLDGDWYDEYGTYAPGDFIVRAPGAVHSGGSRGGALVLLVYSP